MNADDKLRWLAPSRPIPIDEDEPPVERESHEWLSGERPDAALPGRRRPPLGTCQ
jgi:hypothetical protein